MANKKRNSRRKRAQQRSRPGKGGPVSPTPATSKPQQQPAAAAPSKERREAAVQRRRAQQRRKQLRYVAIVGLVVLLAAGFLVFRVIQGRALAERLAEAGAAAGCTDVQRTAGTGAQQHLRDGEATQYDTSPPAHGPHSARSLPAGVYSEPFSEEPFSSPTIFEAVHSLEHGYVIAWHNDLDTDEREALEDAFRSEHKTIVVPYENLEDGHTMALSAWGRLMSCEQADTEVVRAFIDNFRERTAPEPEGP